MKGYIHSKESFGTVDGPGIRYVLFMQGCPMRCLYCHNPDTWKTSGGVEVTVSEIIEEYQKNRQFYSNGGITVTGGEPLLQVDFLIELFSAAKENGIHTCIDTSGITYTDEDNEYRKKLDRLMDFTDLVMLDIKHIDPKIHKRLTAHANDRILAFAKYLEKRNMPLWIRHVVLDGYCDAEHLFALGQFIGGLKNLRALDVLPYHTMGEAKYREMKIDYPLAGVPATTQKQAAEAKNTILSGIYSVRRNSNKKPT